LLQDVLNWDAQIFPVDFINFHIYPNPKIPYDQNEFERYNSILKWFSESYKKPWTIGETGLWGNNKANKINPNIATEKQQKAFAEASLAYSRWYGAIGYVWWQYKEVPWVNDTLPGAKAKYLGLVRIRDDNENYKETAEVFMNFDPNSNDYQCFDPDPELLYNLRNYSHLSIRGKITTRDGSPLKNVFIIGQSEKGSYYTFTNEKGDYRLFTKPDEKIFSLIASYPGMSVSKNGTWKGPRLNSRLDLQLESLNE